MLQIFRERVRFNRSITVASLPSFALKLAVVLLLMLRGVAGEKSGEEKEDGSKTKTVINSSRIGTQIRLSLEQLSEKTLCEEEGIRGVQGSPES